MANKLTQGIREILSAQGLTFDGSDDDLTVALGGLGRKELFEKFPDFDEEYRAIREANSPGTLAGIANTGKNAFDRSRQAFSTIGGIGESAAENIAEAEQRIQSRPSAPAWEDWQRSEGADAAKVFLRDPVEILSNIVVSGFTGSIPAIAGGVGGGLAGAKIGGASGTAAGPAGTLAGAGIGGVVGAAAGTGAGSLAVEYGNKYLDVLREAGADLTDPESIKRVVADPAVQERARDLGLKRGLPVAAFDALSAGLAGKFLKGVRAASTAQNIRRGLTEAGIQGALGGAGEVAGALSAGENVSPRAVFEEVVGELGPGAAEVGGAAIRRRMAEQSLGNAPQPRVIAPNTPSIAPEPGLTMRQPWPEPVVPEAQPVAQSPARRVALMGDEEKAARFAELSEKSGQLLGDEVQELELLRALLPAASVEAPVAPATEPVPVDVSQPAPVEAPLDITGLESATVGQPSPAMGVAGESVPEPNVVEPAVAPIPPADFLRPAPVGVPAPVEQAQVVGVPAPIVPTAAEAVQPPTTPTLPSGAPAPTVPQLTDVAPAPEPSATVEERLREEIKKPLPFDFGAINEGSGVTVDLRDDPRVEALTPEMVKQLPVTNATDETSNKSKTRVAVVLEAPDGRYVKTGLLVPQTMAKIGAASERDTGPAVQLMAARTGKGGATKVLKEGGNMPALLSDVIGAGYKLRAVVHFDADPGVIFQRFTNRAAYDASYGATKRTNASSEAAKMVPTASAAEGIERKKLLVKRDTIQRQIDTLGKELSSADPARAAEINDEIQQLYVDLGKLPEPRLAEEAPEVDVGPALPAQADRANQFALVTARLRQAGARVDIFARTFLQQQLASELNRNINALIERYPAAKEEEQPVIQAAIELGQKKLAALDRVRGVAYSANHIALGLEDIQSANLADLVVLLHEAGHAVLKGDPQNQARVIQAASNLRSDLISENKARTEQSGFNTSVGQDPEELVVQVMAQRLADEGVPDAPSLARALVQWVKDLYYRLAMAVQASFGREPSPKLALDWFENQLRRLTGGDYDYRFGDIFNRWTPQAPAQQAHAIGASEGTPGGVTDFYDPLNGKVRQPDAEPITAENVDWNLRFAEEAPTETGSQEIPYREAKARIMGAAVNEILSTADQIYADLKPEGMSFEEFWSVAGRGDAPKIVLAQLEQQVPGASQAVTGGERMTEPMNQQARVQTKQLLKKWQWKNQRRIALDEEQSRRAEKQLVGAAKLVNKIEADLRNAEMHEATLGDKLKEMVRALSKGMRRGLNTAFAAGELAEAVREAEELAEQDPIPARYQDAFKAILADEVRVFGYLNSIAKLDMPLADMTMREILAGIEDNAAGDPVLARLIEPRNKPLLVALTTLAKKNADQMDLIQLRAIREPEKYLAAKAELDAIRTANDQQLKDIAKAQREGKKAATFVDRIKRSYVEKRANLRRMQETIQRAESRRDLLVSVNAAIAQKVSEVEADGLGAPSEWMPVEGAKWLAMQQDKDGAWKSVERTLRFTPEGPSVDAEGVRADLAQNTQWLKANEKKAGSKLYERVKRQTQELQMLDVQQVYPPQWRHLFDKVIQPLGQAFAAAGGASAAEIQRMLNNFQFIQKSYWHGDLEDLSLNWTAALRKVEEATGIKDHGEFFSQIYDPVLYYIQTEPGLEEGPALREAVRAAKRRLTKEPAESFDETFKDFLRRTKAISERYVQIAEQYGAFVKDPRLGGELRRAVAQGWLTVMRRVNTPVVSALTTDMQNVGWKLQFEDDGKGGKRIVKSSTFDALFPDGSTNDEAKVTVLENPEALSKAVAPFFTPNITRTWLTPFLTKPGEPLFRYHGEEIDQLDVQEAWQKANGNVVAFIDRLGASIGPEMPEDNGAEALSPEAEFRMSMLRQIDDLFAMESRMAADAAQTKNLFDPMGPKPHVVMDARLNELIPPEHLEHVRFDPINARNLLATLAFHGAFGRNGERMTRTLDDLKSSLAARKNEFESLPGTSESARKAQAAERGIDYAAAKKAARSYRDILSLQESLKGMFAFNQQAGVLGDMRTGLEVLHFITGQTVNNPKTAFLNLLQPAQRALVQRSLGVEQTAATGVAYAEMAKQVLGSIFENFGLHILRASDHAKEIGAIEGQGYGNLPWSVVMSDVGKGGRFQDSKADQWVIRPLRLINAAQRKGVRVGFGESKDFSRLNVVPGVGGVMNYLSQVAATANGVAEVWALERIVKAGMDYFATHPEKASDPAFRFTAADLGLKNRAWFSDEGTFNYFRRKTVEYGVGNLEDIVRGAMERQASGERLLTREQALRTAMIANNELDLQASINTRPAGWATNPILKFGLPLLGWPIAQMNQVHQALKTEDGRASWKAAFKGLGIMAAWSLPMGLAFTLMTDEYDDRILKRKSNLSGVDKIAAVPLVGPLLALTFGDRGLGNGKGIVERLSKAGNIYGVGADAFSQTLNSIDPTSGQRPFSLDQRVLVFSQFLNIQQALSNLINQGGTATWASVERPLVMAMGGNGALHAIDVFNGVLGLDNAESRMVHRTNALQWLRAAGREAGMELRSSGGGSVAPTPVSVWLREMQFAAMANDRLGFLDAYRRAVDAARDEGKPNPEQAVLSGWKARDPLDVFRTKPSDIELSKLLGLMSDNGKQAVQDAVRLFDQYTALIAPTKAEIYQRQVIGQMRRGPTDLQSLRRQLAGGSLSFR